MRRLAYILLLSSTFVIQVHAQNTLSDSLLRLVREAPMDSSRVLLINELASSLREADSNLAFHYAQQARDLATQLQFKRGLGTVLENIGWIYYRQGNYFKAVNVSLEALQIAQEIGDKKEIANCLINIGAINLEQKLYPAAIINFKKAYVLGTEIRVNTIRSRSLNNMAFGFIQMHQLDSARHYTLRAINENVNDEFRSAFSKRTLGDIYFEEGNYPEALVNWNDCLKAATQQTNNFLVVTTLVRLGNIHLKLNKPDKALVYLNQSLPIAIKNNFKSELENSFNLLAKVYFAKNDFSRAYQYQNQYHTLHDSLATQRSSEQMAIAQAHYESDIKNAQIELLTKNALFKENEIRVQKIWIYISIGWLIFLLVIMYLLNRSNRRSEAINKMLAEKNMFINEQSMQLAGLNTTKDKLFSIIGHDMRSPLASIRGLMDLVGNSAMTQDEFIKFSTKLKKNLDHVHSDLENLLSWAQTQQKGLVPIFENSMLRDAVQEKIDLMQDAIVAKSIKVINLIEDDISIFADKNQVGSILKNLLGNAVKFNLVGGVITIHSVESNGQIQVSISDTGTGMSELEVNNLFKGGAHFSRPGTQNEKGIGVGLLLVKEFIELNKGSIHVESYPGKGSTFIFSLKGKRVPIPSV